jgi:hypothetical protein
MGPAGEHAAVTPEGPRPSISRACPSHAGVVIDPFGVRHRRAARPRGHRARHRGPRWRLAGGPADRRTGVTGVTGVARVRRRDHRQAGVGGSGHRPRCGSFSAERANLGVVDTQLIATLGVSPLLGDALRIDPARDASHSAPARPPRSSRPALLGARERGPLRPRAAIVRCPAGRAAPRKDLASVGIVGVDGVPPRGESGGRRRGERQPALTPGAR